MFERYKNRKNEKRSPLNVPPLRYAGQSLDEQIQKIIEDKIDNLAVMGSVPFGFALYEWITWYFKMPPQPMIFTVIAIILAGYSLIRIRSYKRQIKNLRQASQGEKAVGQYLEALMEKVMAFAKPLQKRRNVVLPIKKTLYGDILRIFNEEDPPIIESGRLQV